MPVRKHAAWIPEFDRGQMVMAESGIFESYFFRKMHIKARRDKFYSKQNLLDQDSSDKKLELKHMRVLFVLLVIGGILSVFAFITERMNLSFFLH